MKTKEDWISETMASLDGIQRAESDPMLMDKVLIRMNEKPGIVSFFTPEILRIAAMILLLISFNVFTFIYFAGKSDMSDSAVKSVATEYFSYIDSFNL